VGRTSQKAREIIDRLSAEKEEFRGRPKQDLKRLWRNYLSAAKGRLLLTSLITVVWSGQPFAFALTGRYLVDRVLRLGTAGPAEELSTQIPLLILWIGLLFAIWAIFLLCHWLRSWLIIDVGKMLIFRLRKDLHEKLQDLHMGYFDQNPTGRIMSRVLDDVKVIQQWSTTQAISLISQSIRLMLGLGMLFYLNWRLTFLVLAALPLYGFTFYFLKPRIRKTSIAQRRLNASMYARAAERISGIQVVKAFSRERGEIRAFAKLVFQSIRVQLRMVLYQYGLVLTAGIITAVTTGLAIYFVMIQVKTGQMSLGSAVAFTSAIAPLFMPVNALTTLVTQLQSVMVVLRRIFYLLDQSNEVSPGSIRLDGMKGKIRFEGVTFAYPGQEDPALKDVSFRIREGEQVALMGPSGAGKSTIFMLLLRFYDPGAGEVRVGGVNLLDADLGSIRRHVCMVQQEPIIFSGTLAENVMYGRLDATPSQVMRAAKRAELHEFIMSLPGKYETEVGEGGVTLSGGQKQRLSLSTALLTDPEVLLLDDTTSALDAATEARIRTTLSRVLDGRTSLIITQRIATARESDRILVFEKGRLTQSGTHDQLADQSGFYRKVCEEQKVLQRQ
jgi:subfamily B ATP-binding cassette protein MsbA